MRTTAGPRAMRAVRAARSASRRGCFLAVPCCAVIGVVVVCSGLPPWAAFLVSVAVLLVGERAVADRRHRRALAHALRLAGTDELTGLANRRALLGALRDSLVSARPVGLMVVDLDGFKAVNDTHGHVVGDYVLQVVAARLREAMSGSCLVARLGGDEFAALGHDAEHQALPALAGRVRASLARPVPVAPGCRITVGTSIGTTRAALGATAGDLLRQADNAMYRAKIPGPAPSGCSPPASR
jgi:diguanylate cyclase